MSDKRCRGCGGVRIEALVCAMPTTPGCVALEGDLRRRLAATEAQLVAMKTALRACVLWMKPGGMRGTVERDAAREAGEAALAQPHSTEALRDFMKRTALTLVTYMANKPPGAPTLDEVVDAVLRGAR